MKLINEWYTNGLNIYFHAHIQNILGELNVSSCVAESIVTNCRTFQPCRPLSTMNAILVLSVPIVWNPIPNTTPTLFLLSLCLKPSVYLVNSTCLYSLSFVTYFSQLQTHTQSRYTIGHLCSYTSHNTIGQCSL